MLFALLCTDREDALALRLATRDAHIAYLNELNDRGTLKFAGPFLDADGKPNGSLVVVEADSSAEAKALAASDPYAKAELFASVEIKPWNWVFNAPVKN
ncbi:YciI-like protein [Limoniibacter endophyticus]|uniref:YCII-related domain-containing protein n=1 Tax=Limoniibacter endophyticus TaxID=1565040 RepID=A0A8J3GIS8_9HYPH|nr:YciI-like protein [Limoniibacter endophyticus]GHC73966.1 hypothetical protein GCM10010136_22650 [Limoniibacter endophyticus]